MKKMKTSLAIAVALAIGVTTSVFADNVKEGNISFTLTAQRQTSVSDTTAANAGVWVDSLGRGPTHYKTGSIKITQSDLIKAVAYVLHGHNANYYGNTAKLVLVQGELSGFFTETPDLSNTIPSLDLDGDLTSSDLDSSTTIANSSDSLFTILDSGRHFETNPITGQYPVGHLQPWGQIYVKYLVSGTNKCENATEFFGITVQECYDCFYLNSYISDSLFTYKTTPGSQSGPPCCSTPSSTELFGNGVDRYYVTINFDDTQNNPYLNPNGDVGTDVYVGFPGISPSVGAVDGILPDAIAYTNPIASHLGSPSQYEGRFTLNGILTYSWALKLINNTDAYPDFIGNATVPVTGYGFIQLYCSLLTGTVAINETAAKVTACCPQEDYLGGYWGDDWEATGDYHGWGFTDSSASLNSNLYFSWVGYVPSTPFNTGANLSYHANFNETYTPFLMGIGYTNTPFAPFKSFGN